MSMRVDLITRGPRPSVTHAVSALVEEYVDYLSQIVVNATPQEVMVWALVVVPTILTLVSLSRSQKKRAVETGTEGLYAPRASGSQSSTPTNRMQRDLDLFNSDIFFNSPDDPNSASIAMRNSRSIGGGGGEKWAVKAAGRGSSAGGDSVPLLREHVERNQRVQPLHGFASPAQSLGVVSDLTLPSPFQPSMPASARPASHVPSSSSSAHMIRDSSAHANPPHLGSSYGNTRTSASSIKSESEMMDSHVRGKLALKQFVHSFYRTIGGNGIRVQLLRKGKLVYRFLKLDRDKECLYWNTGSRWPKFLRGARREWPVKNIKTVAKGMRIYIETFNSKVFTLEAEPSELAHHIKVRVADKEGLNINDVALVFEGKVLASDRSLVSFGIENGATVYLTKVAENSKRTLLQNVDRMVKNQLVKTGPFGFELVLQSPDKHHKLKVYMLYVERESERDFFVRNFNYLIQNLELASTVMRSLNPVANGSSGNLSNTFSGATGVSGGGDVDNELWLAGGSGRPAAMSSTFGPMTPDDVSIAESDNSYSTMASADMRHLSYHRSNSNARSATSSNGSGSGFSGEALSSEAYPLKPRPLGAGDEPDGGNASVGLGGDLARRGFPLRGSMSGNTNTMKSKLSLS